MAETGIRIQIPASLRRLTGGVQEVRSQATSVRALVDELEARFPGLRARLCDGDRLKSGVAVAVNSRISATGLTTALPDGAEVTFLPAVAGG
jgi:molybdopterin converting factor small subunit